MPDFQPQSCLLDKRNLHSCPGNDGASHQEYVQHLHRAWSPTGKDLALGGWSNQQIAQAAGTSDRQVRKWRARWESTQSLADAPRSGAPRRFSP